MPCKLGLGRKGAQENLKDVMAVHRSLIKDRAVGDRESNVPEMKDFSAKLRGLANQLNTC